MAITAHHIAAELTLISGLISAMAAGAHFPALTLEQIDQGNVKHAQDFANCTRQETVEILRRDGPAIAGAVRVHPPSASKRRSKLRGSQDC